MTSTLWPGALQVRSWHRGPHSQNFVLAPRGDNPTQLLALRAASLRAVATRASDIRPRHRQLRDTAAMAALFAATPFARSRQLSIRESSGSIIDMLRQQVNADIRSAVILCGPARANQKPVLQLLDRLGRTLGFAKVSWNGLTTDLLDQEQRALEHLATANCDGFAIPRILGAGEFAGGKWLAISAVGVERRAPATPQATLRLARAIERTGKEWTGSAIMSPFLDHLLQRAKTLPISHCIVNQHAERQSNAELTLGAWHGDFVPWNMLSGSSCTAVWDWERYDQAVPLGFDRFHYAVQNRFYQGGGATASAIDAVGGELARLTPELGARAPAHFDWYLVELLCRYEHDAILSRLPALATRVTELAAVLKRRWSAS